MVTSNLVDVPRPILSIALNEMGRLTKSSVPGVEK